MALPKIEPLSSELKSTVAPYPHQLNGDGTGCLDDCPACRWEVRTRDAPWNEQHDKSAFQ